MKTLHKNHHKIKHKQLNTNQLQPNTKQHTHYKDHYIYYLKTFGKLFSSKEYLIKI